MFLLFLFRFNASGRAHRHHLLFRTWYPPMAMAARSLMGPKMGYKMLSRITKRIIQPIHIPCGSCRPSMAKAPFVAAVVFSPRPPCGGRWVVHLLALFDFFIVSINISAAATSTANKMLTIARFIVVSSFPHTCFSIPFMIAPLTPQI